ncbi:selenoneine biosynthesis selenosugar synthase SenB [Sulfurirhabdus autotrophica]|uniref:Putative glycosyltransferase (TIGR04348 family) n=1 Tax=Sulfurirhabdus autotrophica TaxID=1706046 RepID=A0A4R3YDS0_9PROT|nr:selenoneine biosynthesis selenosugar synthase SenB [Sulfurirhabdus autotrophica]TCV90196.1 putative glycosyltransferase (TIGR04348 family) [Sulfurirhabdus autotrophica]
MKIIIITPTSSRFKNGNHNTAQRWARYLREGGHQVKIQQHWDRNKADMMIALHARRSYDSIKQFSTLYPNSPLIVVLTGTDLYRDIKTDPNSQESMNLATRLLVLQDMGRQELTEIYRIKTDVLYQSAMPLIKKTPPKRRFEVSLIGHLRDEKDPFRSALATLLLPPQSKIHITHIGRAMEETMADEARNLMKYSSRYTWIGEIPHSEVRRKLAHSHLMVITSKMEGGANVICEALMGDIPIISSAVSGNIGMLGEDYAGYFPCGNEKALAELLWRAESDPLFYSLLKTQCAQRKHYVQPEKEKIELLNLVKRISEPIS